MVLNLSSQVQFKFVAEDKPENDGCLVEAALDDFLIEYITSGSGIVGDINSDEAVDVLDIVVLVNMVLGFESSNFLKNANAHSLNSDYQKGLLSRSNAQNFFLIELFVIKLYSYLKALNVLIFVILIAGR